VPGAPPRAVVPASAIVIRRDAEKEVAPADVPKALGELSARLGVPLRAPRPDELEMAVRGPDGRRHPWGNGRERRAAEIDSPWGLRRPLATPEWVERDGELLALGPAVEGCCGPVRRAERAGLRPVLGS
jgi:hypothetical protein